ncbi:hypothetical protein [Nocardioides sp. SYSU D00038]|uniref:SCO6745 family protein n=1 Tax=Nocardioides sp. SYSU D00038 TaxID=2812554 RepID=UPI00196739FB|nr:hypothetical protein [Nocardioides sp. SYSU D00038]
MTLTPFWRAVETLHDVVYFAADTRDRYAALGLRGYWMGYFASRAGALGEAPPEVVTAAFHGFAPAMVARALPDAWRLADRQAVLEERVAIASDALARCGVAADAATAALAERLAPVVAELDLAGKPLAAAESTLPVPDDPLGALWRRATVLREYRGDVHVGCLVAAGLGGAAANVLQVGTGRGPAEQQSMRGWSDEAWAAARALLVERGWLAADGTATDLGVGERDRLEELTDAGCVAFLDEAGRRAAYDVGGELLDVARLVAGAGGVPYPNPVGVPRP